MGISWCSVTTWPADLFITEKIHVIVWNINRKKICYMWEEAATLCVGWSKMFSIFSPNLQVPGDTGSMQGFVNTGASSLIQRSARFLHYGLCVQGSSLPFTAFSFSLLSSSMNSFPLAISAIVCGLRGWGRGQGGGCRFLALLILIWRCLISFPLTSSLYQMPPVNHRSRNAVNLVFL